jgi:hypothetical protein
MRRLSMKKHFTYLVAFILLSCGRQSVKNIKDLEQSMMDLKIYQENLGDEIRAGRLKDAVWLLNGVDSITETLAETFTEHRKLKEPFAYYKKLRLDKPIEKLYDAFEDNDTANARRQYIILVDNCNKCHIDLEIEKDVRY